MLNKDFIAFRKGFVVTSSGTIIHNSIKAFTLQAELMRLGYMLDFSVLPLISDDRAVELYNNIVPNLKDLIGDGNYTPLYLGFPQEVMEKSDSELLFDQLLHYASNGNWKPSPTTVSKPQIFEHTEYKMITPISNEDFSKIFTDIVSVNQSLAPFDQEVIEWFVKNETKLVMPTEIPFKETLCKLAAMGVPNLPVKTPTDVLRIAVALSDGDISLPAVPKKYIRLNAWSSVKGLNTERDNFKFKKFTRAERRYLLSLLESTSCDVSEMKLKLNRWIRLGEIIHPSQYANKFPKVYEAFGKLRNNANTIKTWNSQVLPLIEKGVDNKTLMKGLTKLTERPGEFARRLDFLLRTHNTNAVLGVFSLVASKVSNKVLFELLSHFKNRLVEKPRVVFIKGKSKPTKLAELSPLSKEVVDATSKVIWTAIMENFAKKDKMEGTYFIDPMLKKLPTPTNMRSMSDSLLCVPRGARIPLQTTAKCIRFYTHWVDENGHEDLDLSAFLLGENGESDQISWNGNLKTGYGCHSGDVRHVKGDCAEYVDIMVDNAINSGYRYVVMNVYNYEGRPLNSIKSTIGWMEREYPEANRTWYPQTVTCSIKLDSTYTQSVVAIIDLKERELIYVDENDSNMYTGAATKALELVNRYVSTEMVSVYDILKMNVEARGGNVSEDRDYTESYVDANGDTVSTIYPYPSFEFDDFFKDYTKVLKYML